MYFSYILTIFFNSKKSASVCIHD